MGAFLERFRVDLLLLLVAASWGSTYLVAKELVSAGTVLALLALRMLLAAAVMAATAGVLRKRLTRTELFAGMPIGVLLAAVFAFETFGIAHTSATNAGLIISLTMVFTPVLESVLSRRRLPGTFFAAAIVAVTGVVLLAGNGTFDPPSAGDLLVLGAAVVRAVHVVSLHKLTGGKAMDSLHLTTVQLGTCALLFMAGSFVYGDSVSHYLFRLDHRQGVMLLYLVLICTVFAFFIQIWAVRRTSPSRVSLLLGTEPVWAAIIGIAIAGDSIGIAGYCGIAFILAGTAWGRSTEQRHHLAEPQPACSEPRAASPEKENARPGLPAIPLVPSRSGKFAGMIHIERDDPTRWDVHQLLSEHLADMFATSPAESVHALAHSALSAPSITFWTAREKGELLGCGALKLLDSPYATTQESPTQYGEIKSMRTTAGARGRGVATLMLKHIVDEARRRDYQRVCLETGPQEYFAPARRLYVRNGFTECPPFADYSLDPHSVFMELRF